MKRYPFERCNNPAWRMYPNSYRVCRDHAEVNNPDEKLYENQVGPCDYPMNGKGAMRFDRRMRGLEWIAGVGWCGPNWQDAEKQDKEIRENER